MGRVVELGEASQSRRVTTKASVVDALGAASALRRVCVGINDVELKRKARLS